MLRWSDKDSPSSDRSMPKPNISLRRKAFIIMRLHVSHEPCFIVSARVLSRHITLAYADGSCRLINRIELTKEKWTWSAAH